MSQRSIGAIEKMDPAARLARCERRIEAMVDHLRDHIALHYNNEIIQYSPLFSGQIPRSYAANAYRSFTSGLLYYEIVSLCTFWDSLGVDKINIPTVVKLASCPYVVSSVSRRAERSFLSGYGEPARTEIRRSPEPKGVARRERHRLYAAIRLAETVRNSPELKSVLHLRNKFLAHKLERTWGEGKQEAKPVVPMKHGDQRDLVTKTIQVVDGLHNSINGKGFSWESSTEIAKSNAEALWRGCKFDVLR